MDIIVKYIDELLEKSTPEAPMWNIEKIKQGLKSKWNYIDGCMIKAVLQEHYFLLMMEADKFQKTKNILNLQTILLIIVYLRMEQLTDIMLVRKISIMLMRVRHFLNFMTSQEKKSTEKQLTLFIRR